MDLVLDSGDLIMALFKRYNMLQLAFSGSKDLASSFIPQNAHTRWESHIQQQDAVWIHSTCNTRSSLSFENAIEFWFQFSAETEAERAEWTRDIQKILETPLLPQVRIASTGKLCFHGKALWKLVTVSTPRASLTAESNQCSPTFPSGQQSGGVPQQEEERLDCIFQQMISTQKIERALLSPKRIGSKIGFGAETTWTWFIQKHKAQVTLKIIAARPLL